MPDVHWRFDNTYVRLPPQFHATQPPTPTAAAEFVVFNRPLARDLGLDLDAASDADLARMFSGNALPAGAQPIAQAYAGHQFGHFAVLGDGRAVLLGEHVTPTGARFDLQLKGSGPTPYSRRGDGRAALGPMLREYVISEAMHALGIPTTRSLAVVATGEPVYRERPLPGAVLTRVAASHLRVGTFEFAAVQDDRDALKALVDYAIDRHYPQLRGAPVPALALLRAVGERQLALVIDWLRVGFIHGVMNTDNVSICGETIDYGPCAFLDAYDPATVFSSIDHAGRYAFGNQPRITLWNLARFAEALLPLFDADEAQAIATARAQLQSFSNDLETGWLAMMGRKLGLVEPRAEDHALFDALLAWMKQAGADYTNTFRALVADQVPAAAPFDDATFRDWHRRWRERQAQQDAAPGAAAALMRAANPVRIPRNHQVEAALTAAGNGRDLAPLHALLAALASPYADDDQWAAYAEPPAAAEGRVYQTFCGT
jgi:serine/tyrosine/threonine adenylyltransferase